MNLKKMISVKGILVMLVTAMLFACKPEPVAVTGVLLDQVECDLGVGSTVTLTATVLPADATNKKIEWSVAPKGIVEISAKENVCTVKAVKAGDVTVTAKTEEGGKTATCKITAKPVSVTGITLDPPTLKLPLGTSETVTAAVLPENATNKTVTWTAEPVDAVELTDNKNGSCTVKALTKGTVTVTAKTEDGGKTATCTVTVKPILVRSIYFSGYPHASVGGTFILESVIYPEDATNKKLDWTATVEGNPSEHITLEPSEDGTACTVTIAKGFGKDPKKITFKAAATDGSEQSGTYTVTSTWISVTEILLNKPTLALKNGESAILTAAVLPENASDKTVTWAIDGDGSVATGTDNGDGTYTVTAVGSGNATVTVTGNDDPGKTAACQISVDPLGNTAFIEAVGDKCTWTKEEDGTVKLTPENLTAMAAVTELDLSNKGLTDLGGIEYFTGLTDLNLQGNALTALDVTKNTALTDLDCTGNQLTAIDVSNNTELVNLNLQNNRLTALDVSKNTKLQFLSCNNSLIGTLDVSKNTELLSLSCTYCGLTNLDVSANTKLQGLRCYNNELTELDVSGLTELKQLQCSDNRLAELDLSANTKLTWINCDNNRFAELDISHITYLQYLYCGIQRTPDDSPTQILDLILTTAQKVKWDNEWSSSSSINVRVNPIVKE